MKTFQDDKLYHLPDIVFSKFCEQEYKVNKGVYNTIDQWFFNYGFTSIVERRETIIDFIHNIYMTGNKEKVKFGHGGLTKKLIEYSFKIKRYNIKNVL
ncbi:hypothetical protein V7127_18080 [Bacillus sp. JJ1773]|uniref:hypothetical protein n=1 Tax=Bacillus sp. JJ1773 TaxID=3122965 RepID=UPI002FFF00A9